MKRRLPLLLALAAALAAPAAAQPSPDALVSAWLADWRRSGEGVTAIEAAETLEREVNGPRGRLVVEVEGRIGYARGARPERRAERVFVNGREADPRRLEQHRRRVGRAFGAGGAEADQPPRPPGELLAAAEPVAVEEDPVDGRPAWRVTLRPEGGGRLEAWFAPPTSAPRLLRTRHEQGLRRGGRVVREAEYARVGGLDLPATTRATVTVRQRRRLRDYAVTFSTAGRYSDYRVTRR